MAQFLINDGLDGLGKFSLKKLIKKVAPPAIVKKLVPPVLVPKQILEVAPILKQLPGVVQIPTTIKEAKAMQKEDIKEARTAYVDYVMKPLAKVDPTMKLHYEHELRDNEMKRLRVEIAATEDPVKRQALEGQLKRLEKKEAAYQKQGAIVRTIVSIAAVVVPVLAPIAIYLQAANAAYAAAMAKRAYDNAREAKKNIERSEAEVVAVLVKNDVPRDQALRIVALIRNGMPVDAALKSVLSGAPAPATNQQEWKPVKLETPEAAQQAFMNWLKGWRPEVYDAVMEKINQSQSLNGYAVDDDTGEFVHQISGLSGLGFWDSFATAASSIVSVAGSVLKTMNDQKVVELQLKQLKAQQAPMPTPVAEKAAATGQMPVVSGVPSWLLPAGLGVAALGLGVWFFMRRRRGRGRK
ncbi:MAG TPA: hypothetical protein VJ437_13140 [Acidiferrobacterales bacterium]|nr:hypothetical protein [Acidiferrobacterales bacterium]